MTPHPVETTESRRSVFRSVCGDVLRAALPLLIVLGSATCMARWIERRRHTTDLDDYADVRDRQTSTAFRDVFPADLTPLDVLEFSQHSSIDAAQTTLRIRYADEAELARILAGRDTDAFAVVSSEELMRREDLPVIWTWDRGEYRPPPDGATVVFWRCSGITLGTAFDPRRWGGVGYVIDRSARECTLWAEHPYLLEQ